MAAFGNQLYFFLLLVLVLSPKLQAREAKLFGLFTHFRTAYNVKDPQFSLKKAKADESPAPAPTTAPTPAPLTAPTPAPAAAPETESIIASGPAPEPDFVDRGDGYGLYGSGSSQYSPTKETPTTTTFENELLNEDFTGETYKTGYPKTNVRSNYNGNYNNEVYRNNYNNEEYRSNYKNGYNMNYVDSYSSNYNDRYSNKYNGNEYNNNYNFNGNGYERKREGISDTRFMENGKYYYPVKTDNENYNLNGYESGIGSTQNEGYYKKSQYPNEFDTMEEYEKQQASQGYTP